MTTPNSTETVSHVEIAALVTRLALKRLEAQPSAPELERIKRILDRWIESSIAQ